MVQANGQQMGLYGAARDRQEDDENNNVNNNGNNAGYRGYFQGEHRMPPSNVAQQTPGAGMFIVSYAGIKC
jgi:hypothetical protein